MAGRKLPFAAICLVFALACGGSDPAPQPPTPPPTKELVAALPDELASFDYVWDAVNRTYWEPDKIRERWDAARAELRPKIAAAKTRDEARQILRELLGRLGQSHFSIIGGEAKPGEDTGGPGTLGMDVRVIDDQVVVWRVAPKGPAAAAGIVPGMIIAAVGKQVWTERLAKLRERKGEGAAELSFLESSMASGLIRGRVGSDAVLTVVDGKGASKEVTATWAKPAGVLASFGLLTDIPVEYESRSLSKSIGYIRLSVFFDPVMVNKRFRADVARFAKAKGLVLDLRGNPGGLGGMAMGLGGQLITKGGDKLGTMISRDSKMEFVLNPQPGAFGGKLAILVDSQCASTCEILAGGLADIGRAKTFGEKTAGAALPSQIEALPNGDLLQYATANYISANGAVLEGAGVTPTNPVSLDRESLLAGKDPQLAAAVAWIKQQGTP